MNLFSGTIHTLENGLDYASLKNRAISSNIANVDTPGYKAKEVVFQDVLNEKMAPKVHMKKTHPKHFGPKKPEDRPFGMVEKRGTTYHHNGNNVDIDKEMAELAKNQIYYNSLAERINGKFQSLQNVIRGGN